MASKARRGDYEQHTGDPMADLAYEKEFGSSKRGRSAKNVDSSDTYDDGTLPHEVIDYLVYFARMVEEEKVNEIHSLYEHGFPELTERFFRERHWPDETQVESIVGSDNRIFIILYKELYFRYVYSRSAHGPSLGARFDSFMNYQDLFSEILNAKEPIALELPNIWLWDIIDEFVYQFQAFCLYKTNPSKRGQEEIEELAHIEETGNAWNIYPVLNILYSLLSKSQINEQLAAIRQGGNPDNVADEFGQSTFYFKLGYFALIGLLRTHVLLADYHQALKTVENLEMDAKGLYNLVPSCLVTLHYFVGFSHMMMRNYGEATKIFVNCLLYIQRTKTTQQTQSAAKKNFQYDVIGKTCEQLYHLLSICLTLQPRRVDDTIAQQLAEKCGDRMMQMAKGDLEEFRVAFQFGCPKFLSPTSVSYDGANLSREPLNRQCQAFLEGLESQVALPILRGYLKLYTTLPIKKLASFMDVRESDYDSFLGKLLTFKKTVTELGKVQSTSASDAVDGDESNTDIDFYVDGDMIVIADTKVARRVGEHFIRHIQKLHDVRKTLKKLDQPKHA